MIIESSHSYIYNIGYIYLYTPTLQTDMSVNVYKYISSRSSWFIQPINNIVVCLFSWQYWLTVTRRLTFMTVAKSGEITLVDKWNHFSQKNLNKKSSVMHSSIKLVDTNVYCKLLIIWFASLVKKRNEIFTTAPLRSLNHMFLAIEVGSFKLYYASSILGYIEKKKCFTHCQAFFCSLF